MKKILITVLSLLLVLSMFGCKEKDMATRVNEAIEKTAALDSYEFNGSFYNTFEIMGFKMLEGTEYTYKAKNVRKNAEYLGIVELHLDDTPRSFNVYTNKDAVYVDDGHRKIFFKHDTAEAQLLQYDYNVKYFLKELPERALKEAVVTEKGDGSKALTVLLNDVEAMLIYKEYFESQSSAESEIKASGSGFKVEITISKNGYVLEYIVTFRGIYTDVSTTGENADASYETQTEVIMTFIDPGEKVTFDSPDVSGYLDATQFDG